MKLLLSLFYFISFASLFAITSPDLKPTVASNESTSPPLIHVGTKNRYPLVARKSYLSTPTSVEEYVTFLNTDSVPQKDYDGYFLKGDFYDATLMDPKSSEYCIIRSWEGSHFTYSIREGCNNYIIDAVSSANAQYTFLDWRSYPTVEEIAQHLESILNEIDFYSDSTLFTHSLIELEKTNPFIPYQESAEASFSFDGILGCANVVLNESWQDVRSNSQPQSFWREKIIIAGLNAYQVKLTPSDAYYTSSHPTIALTITGNTSDSVQRIQPQISVESTSKSKYLRPRNWQGAFYSSKSQAEPFDEADPISF